MRPRKMDWNSEADLAIIREFMAAKDPGTIVHGLPVQIAMWQK